VAVIVAEKFGNLLLTGIKKLVQISLSAPPVADTNRASVSCFVFGKNDDFGVDCV
jgi:hypothetical protein